MSFTGNGERWTSDLWYNDNLRTAHSHLYEGDIPRLDVLINTV